MPDRCAGAQGADSPPCKLHVHHWRERKTGPQVPVLVVLCQTHGVAFTLYPPGHVPYGRVAVAPADLEGQPLRPADHSPSELVLAWEGTIAAAAQDAAEGKAWPRSGNDSTRAPGSWRTQGRHLGRLAGILGLAGESQLLPQGPLGVPALSQREASSAYRDATGYRGRGRAMCLLIGEVTALRCDVLDVMLAAGFAAGCWGRPRRWDARTGRLHDVVPRARSP